MIKMFKNKRAQSTAEYAIIIGVVVGAIMAVGAFLRGAIEAKVRHQTNAYLNGDSNTQTQIMTQDYNNTGNSTTNVKENKGSTKTTTTENSANTRIGKTIYFSK